MIYQTDMLFPQLIRQTVRAPCQPGTERPAPTVDPSRAQRRKRRFRQSELTCNQIARAIKIDLSGLPRRKIEIRQDANQRFDPFADFKVRGRLLWSGNIHGTLQMWEERRFTGLVPKWPVVSVRRKHL